MTRTEQVGRDLVRVFLGGSDLVELPDLTYTDHYVKLLYPPEGADYTWPFDPDEIRESRPRAEWPVTRTYTIRSLDRAAGELAIDFVVHGDEGLAGPWAARAKPGDVISFFGPGGGYAPAADADVHLLVGDESAAPAIAAALDALPDGSRALVFIETSDPDSTVPLAEGPHITTTTVHRRGSEYGAPLAAAVRAAPWPEGNVHAFVHGNAGMIKDLRRYLFVEREVPRDQVSISGYWRSGHNEDAWQASKREFVAQMEADEAALTEA
ncbi:siderophore-interacting protein [Demetria terragena]|uniref:siderophore-interacting protein n=1 Tax=Demetria terragena TaxID=63959 RepID=UPI000684B8F3|nr:siderophore-interacting protein [Demetria terragena]